MDAFDFAFNQTLGLEGGYSDDAADRGGRTNYGITEKTFRDALNRGVISGTDDIGNLTPAQARAIYKTDYWQALKLNNVHDIDIAAEIFDTAVNSGRGKATLIAQLALEYLGEQATADGVMGPVTINLLNKWCQKDPRALFVALNGIQFIHFVAIVDESIIEEITKRVKSDASQVKFSRGWTKRIQSYRKT